MSIISLACTTYNRSHFLPIMINSLLNQTYKNWELHLVDDGSSDYTAKYLDFLENLDQRFKIYQISHRGRGAALAIALNYAITSCPKYLGWLDDDDWLDPQCLELCYKFLIDNKFYDMVYTHYYDVDSYGDFIGLGSRCNIPYSKDRLLLDFMTFHFRLFTLTSYLGVGGINHFYDNCQDYDFCLRFSENYKIGCLPEPLYYYRNHLDSISGQKINQVLFSFKAITEAMERRGLSQTHKLCIKPLFKIVPLQP
jgi:glycosyltransferase involved in cell wall biosynthesis